MTALRPAPTPTMYFIGVSTTQSSIMKVFPAWADELGLEAQLVGIDLPLDAEPAEYRRVVDFIKHDPLSLGALVTTHKLNIVQAAAHLFDELGPDALTLHEVSSISKKDGRLWGQAMDPLTSGLALEAIIPAGYWSDSDAELVLLGAGGSSLALTLYLHRRSLEGKDVPRRIVVSNRRESRLQEMRTVHERIGSELGIEYVQASDEHVNDALVSGASPGSVIVNATGLGKDRPGSPLSDSVAFPEAAVAWDFNYRGDLRFLDQARSQDPSLSVRAEDGWLYFLHGWTRVIADVFAVDIPTSGEAFTRLSHIAHTATQ